MTHQPTNQLTDTQQTGKAPGNASFIRTTRRPDDTLSFLEGLRRKYTTADDPPDAHAVLSLTANKVFEEVGFEKIQKKLGQLKELKIVILDGLCLARADAAGEIAETCPSEFDFWSFLWGQREWGVLMRRGDRD
jgi:hypothetical protein